MDKDLTHFISLSADAVESLVIYSSLFGDLVKAHGFDESSYYYHAYTSLHEFILNLCKNSYAMNPDGYFDLFVKESDFSLTNEQ